MVHQIAAGEVIDSLAAVVRELVDNALDAGATHLTISLWPEQWRVRVADNGNGMTDVDLRRAATPHSTNKIRSQTDLDQIQSLGFRGEALHSLAQLGQLTIASRGRDRQEPGWCCTYNPDGEIQEMVAVGVSPGTIVTVDDLFRQWPARRRCLPTRPRQLRLVQQVIHHSALCHPQVTWTVDLNDRLWLRLMPGPTARAMVPQLLRSVSLVDLAEHQQTLDFTPGVSEQPPAHLYLVAGLPDRCHRPRPDWVKIAINGRLVAIPELEQAVIQGFRHTLPKDRYPLCFLHLEVNPQGLDWNRSPDKSLIYLDQISIWQQQVRTAIDQLLQRQPMDLPPLARQQRVSQLLKTAEPQTPYRAVASLPVNLSDPLPGRAGAQLKAIAQVHNRYILAEQADGIVLIEQHIAHERVLYEQLQQQWQVQPLQTPVVLEHLSPSQIDNLQQLDLPVEAFGTHLWAVRAAPAPLVDRPDLAAALLELSQGGDLAAAQVATACRTAIRNGTPLSLEAMQTLLNQWQRTRHPQTCPHGRPICLTLAESSLARFFRRHWVIGKSHGL